MDYGPPRPDPQISFHQHRTQPYLLGRAHKIRLDLEKWFRMYQGKPVKIYRKDKAAGRCTTCTDAITGMRLLADCPECHGTGYTSGYVLAEECWAMAEVEARLAQTSELGNTETTSAGKDTFLFTSERELEDTDLVIFVDTREIYKVVDREPKMVAMGGTVVMQAAALNYLAPGSLEYNVVDW